MGFGLPEKLKMPFEREAIWIAYHQGKQSVTSLAEEYKVSRPTIYKVLKLARVKLLKPQTNGKNEFAHGNCHINGIESFWSFTKRRLAKFNGVTANFELHLKMRNTVSQGGVGIKI